MTPPVQPPMTRTNTAGIERNNSADARNLKQQLSNMEDDGDFKRGQTLDYEWPLIHEHSSEPDFWGTRGPPRHSHQTVVWFNAILFFVLHAIGVYGFIKMWTVKWQTVLVGIYMIFACGFSVTAGAHRLWAHKCYKAKWPLRLWLMIHNCGATQNHLYEWVRDHRVHHKFTETDADPHNARRGFFFSHIGWLMMRKHPDVLRKGQLVDMSDLEKDPIVAFQRKYYLPLAFFFGFAVPTFIPWYFWNENLWHAFAVVGIFRLVLMLNFTWSVNSFAHLFGSRPYDQHMNPADNPYVSRLVLGEGWHNYHHIFPYDYRASELGRKFNLTTGFIELCCWLGLAHDLKTVSPATVRRRMCRTGNGERMDGR